MVRVENTGCQSRTWSYIGCWPFCRLRLPLSAPAHAYLKFSWPRPRTGTGPRINWFRAAKLHNVVWWWNLGGWGRGEELVRLSERTNVPQPFLVVWLATSFQLWRNNNHHRVRPRPRELSNVDCSAITERLGTLLLTMVAVLSLQCSLCLFHTRTTCTAHGSRVSINWAPRDGG